jgi:hypothetical protein
MPPFQPLSRPELECLERASVGIEQPVESNAVSRVESALGSAIVRGGARRDYLANPIGHDIDRSHCSGSGQPMTAPSGQIRPHDIVRSESDVHLGQDPPASRTTSPVIVIVWPTDEATETALRPRMARKWCRLRHKLPCNDLGADVLTEGEQIVVRCEPSSRVRHEATLARARRRADQSP